MMYLSSITLLFTAPGVVSLGLGLGAAYPDFNSENPAQSVTSFGGLIFMLLSTAFIGIIIILEAGPVYTLFMAELKGHSLSGLQWIWIIGSFIADIVISVATVWFSFKFGENRLRVHLPTPTGCNPKFSRRKYFCFLSYDDHRHARTYKSISGFAGNS